MKKLLALVLALVMSMSLVTISNAAFKDADKISNKEAVDVMAAVGVLAGYDNGEFGATDTLTRAQACKIIAYLDLGKDVAEALPAVQVFSDLPASNWAAKYVAYCADAGYVSGVGDNKFAPDEKVTGYQFGKMLLCALGYDATIEEMTGASWTIKVAKLMEKNSISKGTSKLGAAVLTREEAAQYALNALKATTVEYDEKGSTITAGDVTIVTGAKKATEVKVKNDSKYTAVSGEVYEADKEYTVELGEKLYKGDLKKLGTSETNDFGAPYSHYWTMKGVAGKIAKTAKAASITITKAYDKTESNDVKEVKDLLSAAGVTIKSSDNTFTKTDGTAAPVATAKNYLNGTGNQGAVASVEALMDLTGNGKKVELFINSDKVITDIVATSYSVATVSDITETTKTSSGSVYTTYTVKDKNTNSEYSGKVYTKAAKDESNTATIYSGIAEDDIVTYVVANSKLYVYPTTKVVGQQTAIKGSTITVSGTKYTLAAVTAGTFDNVDKDFAYYIDQYGYAVYTEAVSTTSYAVVLDIAKISGVDGKVEAKLLFTDGSTKIVNVDKAYQKNGTTELVLNDAGISAYKNQFVTYTTDDDGLYTLKQVDESDKITGSASTAAAPAYKKGTPQTIGGKTLDNKTIVLVAYKSSGKTVYGAYTGYAAMPTIYGAAVNGDYVIKSDALKYVFINAAVDGVTVADEADTSTYIYVLSDDVTVTGVGSKKVYTVEVAKDGAATTIGMKQDAYDAVFATAATKDKGLYKVTTVDKDGNVTAVAVADGNGYTKASVTAAGSGVITAGGTFTYDDDTTFVFIDVDGSVRTGSGDSIKTATTASIFYKLKSGSAVKLDTVYVVLKNAE